MNYRESLQKVWDTAFALGYAKAVSDIGNGTPPSEEEIEKIDEVLREAKELAVD